MLESLQILNYDLNYFLDQGDPRVKDWPLMRNPFTSWVLIAAYIYFVKVAGPQWMKNRQPFVLRTPMVIYNFFMVFLCFYTFLAIGWYSYFDEYRLICQPVDYSNSYKAVRMAETGWLFFATKFIEFADTIFFVLRKKDEQVTSLHVIHHSIVPFSLWFGIKFAAGGDNAFFPLLNSLVHVFMYAYYGIAALGPKYKRFLIWKKFMTYMQMGQFVLVIVHCLLLVFYCRAMNVYNCLNILHAALFLVLFYNFFKQSYCNTKRLITKKHQANGSASNGHIARTDSNGYRHKDNHTD